MKNKFKVLELFSGSQMIRKSFEKHNVDVVSIDIKSYRNTAPDTLIMDIMHFDYGLFDNDEFDFLFIGFPCDTFSKASGGKHFDIFHNPKTQKGHDSLLLLKKVFDIIEYFYDAAYMFENPTGAIIKVPMFIKFIEDNNLQLIRTFQGLYGFPTFKQTDLITNIFTLWIDNKLYRKNGIYSNQNFDNLSTNQRHSYTKEFADRIVEYVLNYLHQKQDIIA